MRNSPLRGILAATSPRLRHAIGRIRSVLINASQIVDTGFFEVELVRLKATVRLLVRWRPSEQARARSPQFRQAGSKLV